MKDISSGISAVKVLRIRYISAISILAILVLSSHSIMEYTNTKAEFDSRIINIAGRQRMLSQKITKSVFGIYISEDKKEKSLYLQELTKALELWEKSHYGLIHGDSDLGLPGKNSIIVSQLFDSIHFNFTTIIINATEVIELSSSSDFSKELIFSKLEIIRRNELVFLPVMDKIVFQYDTEAKENVNYNKRINLVLGLITLLTLTLEAIFIFKPLESKVADAIDKLTINEENLRSLFDLSPQPLFLVEPKSYEIIRLNQKASEILSIHFDDAIHRKISDFLEKSVIEKMDVLEYHKFNGKMENIEIILKDNKGNENYMLMSVSRLFYHHKNIFLIGLTNISKQKEQELELSYFATIDEMTGLLNRRAGLLFLEKEFDTAKRELQDLSIVFVDIDNLKKTNDTFGHEKGDELIKNISSIILKNIRQGDVALRYGGDEIILILKFCNIELANFILNRINLGLEFLNKSTDNPFKHEISYGIVQYKKEEFKDYCEFLDNADKLMYANKISKREKIATLTINS